MRCSAVGFNSGPRAGASHASPVLNRTRQEREAWVRQDLTRQVQHELSAEIDLTRWVGSVGLAVAIGIVYFLAARLSLALLTKPEGVAVFWPAAGVSAGVLIALGSRARWPVVVGTMAATIAANLLGDRNLWSAVLFALCNAGEAVVTAWLIEHYFGPDFRLSKLRNVLGLAAAAIMGTAVSGIGGGNSFPLVYYTAPAVFTTVQRTLPLERTANISPGTAAVS